MSFPLNSVNSPSKEQAHQFALMLGGGMPPIEAIRYFAPDLTPDELGGICKVWMNSSQVGRAILQLQGKEWQEMSLEERIQYSINKHYTEMAYFLYSHNYAQLVGADKQKADTCRQTLEAKIAGMSGKTDALTRFWEDIANGRVRLNEPTKPPVQAH